MKRKIIDISIPIHARMPHWPGTTAPRIKTISKIGGRSHVHESGIEINAHAGTHIDAPSHFLKNGKSIDKVPLNIFIGSALVVYLPESHEIGISEVKGIKIPNGVSCILFRTKNSLLWKRGVKKFKKDYVGITAEAARWLSKQNIKLVGVDYLSVAKFDEAREVHKILLTKGIALLEGINLSAAKPGKYLLVSLPISIENIEAALTRAVLLTF